MARAARPSIKFVMSGQLRPPETAAVARDAARASFSAGLPRGKVKQSVRVVAHRGEGADIRLAATPGEDVVVLHIAGGPALVLHPEHARDVLLAQSGGGGSRGGERPNELARGEVRVPVSLQWKGLPRPSQRGARRAALENVLVSAIDIVTGVGKDSAADFAASEVVRRVDSQVDPGLYQLSPESLPKLKGTASPLSQLGAPDGKPLLVLVHGTFCETSGTFGKLWLQHPERVKAVFDHYERRVFGFEHPTLGVGPIENALALANACAPGTCLHLVTHSRGGLVAEVLARVCANAHLGTNDFAFFKGTPYRAQREALRALGEIAAQRKIRIERVVRVACPSRGTLLASKRLDAYVSVLKWALELAGVPVAPAIVDFLGEVARRRTDPELLPGLAAQIPDGPLLRWLYAADAAIPGELRVIAGDIEGDSVVSWLKTLLSDAFFWTDNDLVVQTRSMYSGPARAEGATFLFDHGPNVSHFNYFGNERTAAAVVNALVQDRPEGFRAIGPSAWAGNSPAGDRAAPQKAGKRTPANARPAAVPVRAVLEISVINGDLLFVPQPLMLGHYASLRLTGTEHVVDTLLGGAMSTSLGAGVYPNAPGEHQIFVNTGVNRDNPLQLPRPEAAIVVGLGEEGKLRPAELALAVCRAVIGWSQRLTENPGGAPAVFEIASTLIGSGGVDVAVAQAALLIAQGVRDANERLAETRWPIVGHLHFVELYLDRACEVWRTLQAQVEAAPGDFVVAETVRAGPGALPRLLDSGYRGADYDFISAVTQETRSGEAFIAYTLDTKRARTEVRAQAAQSQLLRQLVTSASADRSDDTDIGRTLFRLLVPREMEPFLAGTTDMQLEVDGGTAGIPWELLDSDTPGGGHSRPWAIRAKLLRKLRIADFRADVADAPADASALVIGEPACDPKLYPRLPGARDEARAVAECLGGAAALGAGRVTSLVSPDDSDRLGPDARTVVEALLGHDWRIVHIAGHGAPPELLGPTPRKEGDPAQKVGNPRGVVLSDGTYLGPREIRNMRVVPELVFVNCCHLAARSAAQVLAEDATGVATPDRARFAAGVAEELIKIGVRCVVAAGWAIDDAAASEFAVHLYGALIRGRRFIDAVAEAREAAFAMGGNTWAAYQCYGDPDWRFVRNVRDAQRPVTSLAEEFAGVAEAKGLALALETLAVRSKYQKAAVQDQRTKILHLEARFATRWRHIGEVAEAFGRAWDAAGDRPTAIGWYAQALGANDGTASLKVVEQLGNLRARQALAIADRRRARGEIAAALRILEQATALHSTIERESLCGSAWKRLAMLEAAARRPKDEAKAIQKMKIHYGRAEALARADNNPQLFYPALNRMAAELAVDAGKPRWRKFDRAAVDDARASLVAKARDDPDFWCVVGLTELRIYVAIADRKLADELDIILGELDDLYARVSAPSEWSSVFDQLRFVLPKYAARASAAEKKAVATLTTHLAGYGSYSPEQSSPAD
jgi:tetratricopeptide (TPR) repeat protein